MRESQAQILAKIESLKRDLKELNIDLEIKDNLFEVLMCLDYLTCCHLTAEIERVIKSRLNGIK